MDTRTSTHPIRNTLVFLILTLLAAPPLEAAEPVTAAAVAARPVSPETLDKVSRSMARQAFQLPHREPLVDELPAATQQQMQESLEIYIRGMLADLLGGGGNGGDEGGFCAGSTNVCPTGYTKIGGSAGKPTCPGRTQKQCNTHDFITCAAPGKPNRTIHNDCFWVPYANKP